MVLLQKTSPVLLRLWTSVDDHLSLNTKSFDIRMN